MTIIGSRQAAAVSREYGEPLAQVLRGYADQAEETGLPRRDLANLLGVSYSTLARWLRHTGVRYPLVRGDSGRAISAGLRSSGWARYITAGGRTLALTDWAARLGCRPSTIHNRIRNGWPEHLAVTAPVGSRFRPRANNLPSRRSATRRAS